MKTHEKIAQLSKIGKIEIKENETGILCFAFIANDPDRNDSLYSDITFKTRGFVAFINLAYWWIIENA